MSRIGKKPISIPQGVSITVDKNVVVVKGPKGTLNFKYDRNVSVKISEADVIVEKKGKGKKVPAIWGTTARIIEGMIEGVTNGFKKQLELNGVGFRMSLAGKKINLALGFSHPVAVDIPEGITVAIEGNVMTVSGIDKSKVGQFAADIRASKPVEPYKGKGFKYSGEHVRRKEGKKSAK
ncbi:MAG TPA: 50S ribosomal protein L6 [Candidatus Moranbacteria bacterium]|jgi:large subunit ribosomal protein L6|nr:50S ribosomal protein L6 [Candidatus Moranbacteria bacterium]HOF42742.1 50S ribosomal protein L6 [Candidatus Moranbacteria bacterium]HPX94430.1 50S ribosomal protein L6 [Candidatus Moranbacteria bacterium]HQB59440.1 50S ribosomal protein L6 [Candidatus Moranbacteria bacterium]